MTTTIINAIIFILVGTLGGASYVVMSSEGWEDFKEFSSQKRIILGAVIGLLYCWLHSDYNWPNNIMVWVAGYAGPSFIDGLLTKYKQLKD